MMRSAAESKTSKPVAEQLGCNIITLIVIYFNPIRVIDDSILELWLPVRGGES